MQVGTIEPEASEQRQLAGAGNKVQHGKGCSKPQASHRECECSLNTATLLSQRCTRVLLSKAQTGQGWLHGSTKEQLRRLLLLAT